MTITKSEQLYVLVIQRGDYGDRYYNNGSGFGELKDARVYTQKEKDLAVSLVPFEGQFILIPAGLVRG